MSLRNKRVLTISILATALLILFVASIFIGSSNMPFIEGIKALFGQGEEANRIIIYNIRIPRIIAAVLAGIALAD